MSYHHITEPERYQIYTLHKVGFSCAQIAQELGRHTSTISRELQRNRGLRGYRPSQAQRLSDNRRSVNARRIDEAAWSYAQARLREEWSPEQIAVVGAGQGHRVSHETIYQRVYADKARGGDLWRHLRCQKKRRKRYASGRSKRGCIPGRIGIEQRPLIVDAKGRYGDWEGDTMIGKGHRQALVTLVERKSLYTVVRKVDKKTAAAVGAAIQEGLGDLEALVHTLTFDNGKEFAGHQAVAETLDAQVYFATPYHSWERGLNENTNGLLRQYFPKRRSFTTISEEEVQAVVERLNNRPRKSLGFKTPAEVFRNAASRRGVALQI